MRTINLIVIHCSASRVDRNFTEDDLEVCHRRRGFNGTGYHFYIRKNGDIKTTREIERIGAHAKGHNQNSIGICYEGGLDCHGHPADTRTEWQIHSMRVLILALLRDGLNFKAVLKEYSMEMDKKGNAVIEFIARNPEDRYEYRVKVFPNGSASIDVNMQNRQSISFQGELYIKEEK